MSQRIIMFIDGSNLYHALEENCGRMDLDFTGFINKICHGRELFRAYYYNILQDAERRGSSYQEQQRFLATLYTIPLLEVRLGSSKQRGEMLVEKGVDVMLAVDILQYAWQNLYDTAILVSGDGDFSYALQTVKNWGKHVEVVAFPGNLSYELAQTADDRHILDKSFFSDLWVSNRDKGHTNRDDEGDPYARKRRRRKRIVPPPKKIIQPPHSGQITQQHNINIRDSSPT